MIYLGADHGGFELKEKVKQWLVEWNISFEDCGAFAKDPQDDYVDFAHEVSRKIVKNPAENKGILICRSGGGMEIAANRYVKIRAVHIFDEKSALHARRDNDANIASFAADWTSDDEVKSALKIFLETPFSNLERHVRRIAKIDAV